MNKASGGDGIIVELTQQWPQDCKWSAFIPVPKKGNAKECSNYHTEINGRHDDMWPHCL